MKKISHWIEKLTGMPVWKSMIILFVVSFVIKIATGIIIEIIYPQIENGNAPDLTKSVFHLFVGISIAPLLETFAFQMLPICIINRFISKNIWTQILPSAILFGSMHYYSLAYVIVTFFIGIVFALGFYIYQRKLFLY